MVLDCEPTPGTGFREDYASPHADPLAHTHEDFPFEEVFASLDGHGSTTDGDRAAEALRQLLAWVVGVRLNRSNSQHARKHVCARALALAWTVNPAMLEGKSLARVAADIGISPDVMHRTSADFSRRFKFRNPGQRHAWNFKPSQPDQDLAAV